MSKTLIPLLANRTILSPKISPRTPSRQSHVKQKWAFTRRKNAPTKLAMDAFDTMYGNAAYEAVWPSIRLALLSMPKHCAVLNNFSANKTSVEAKLRDLGAVPLEALVKTLREEPRSAPNAKPAEESQQISQENERGAAAFDEEPDEEYRGLATEAERNSMRETDEAEFMPASKVDTLEEELAKPPPHVKYRSVGDNRHPILDSESAVRVPYYLNAYVFPRGNISRFPRPQMDNSGFYDYYLLDAASLLPVIALDLQPGENVLDLCAAPGGKSVTMLQTMLPGSLTCNDLSGSRCARLEKVVQSFYPLDGPGSEGKIRITNHDALWFFTTLPFDKVLVDVPCTTDRVSCTEEDNNIFTSHRNRERSQMPQLQLDILKSACDAVRVGGTVVYSTCTLSPLQNDGVVHLAIDELKSEHGIEMSVVDTSSFRRIFGQIYRFHETVSHYGQTVIPHLPNNFGPSYFVKLKKIKAADPETQAEKNGCNEL